MAKPDKDIAELTRLLGHTRAPYRALRHQGGLAHPAPAPRRSGLPRYAIAASLVLAVAVSALVSLAPTTGPDARRSPLAVPTLDTPPLSLRPGGMPSIARPTPARPRTAGFPPRRPARSNG